MNELEELMAKKKVGIDEVLGLDPAHYTLLIVKPGAMARYNGKVIQAVKRIVAQNGFKITHDYNGPLVEAHTKEHYMMHKDKPFFDELWHGMTGRPVYACVIIGKNAREILRTTHAQKTDVLEMQQINPNSLRALYGNPNPKQSKSDNAVHLSDLDKMPVTNEPTNKFEVKTAAKFLGWK